MTSYYHSIPTIERSTELLNPLRPNPFLYQTTYWVNRFNIESMLKPHNLGIKS